MLIQALVWVPAHMKAIQTIHQQSLWSVFRAPMEYFDTTVKGRIVNRFASDQQVLTHQCVAHKCGCSLLLLRQKVDMQLHGMVGFVLATIFSASSAIVAIVVAAPWVAIGLFPLGWIYVLCMQFYRASMRELQRLASVGLSPVYESFGELLHGIATIRAYGEGTSHEQRNLDLLRGYLRPQYYQNVTNEWLSM